MAPKVSLDQFRADKLSSAQLNKEVGELESLIETKVSLQRRAFLNSLANKLCVQIYREVSLCVKKTCLTALRG